jgi:hypothetical protein
MEVVKDARIEQLKSEKRSLFVLCSEKNARIAQLERQLEKALEMLKFQILFSTNSQSHRGKIGRYRQKFLNLNDKPDCTETDCAECRIKAIKEIK